MTDSEKPYKGQIRFVRPMYDGSPGVDYMEQFDGNRWVKINIVLREMSFVT